MSGEYAGAAERRDKFRDLIAAGTGTADAGKLVGYTAGTSREYRRRDRDIIANLVVGRMHDLLPTALVQLSRLVSGAKSEAVRLNAILRVFSQAGLDVPATLNIRSLSETDLDKRLETLLKQRSDEIAGMLPAVVVPDDISPEGH